MLWHSRTRSLVSSINESDGYVLSALWSSQVDPWIWVRVGSSVPELQWSEEALGPGATSSSSSQTSAFLFRFILFLIAKRQFGAQRGFIKIHHSELQISSHVLQRTHTSFLLPDSSPPPYWKALSSLVCLCCGKFSRLFTCTEIFDTDVLLKHLLLFTVILNQTSLFNTCTADIYLYWSE